MTSLVDVALNLRVELDRTRQQLEAERIKVAVRQASERLEGLADKINEVRCDLDIFTHVLLSGYIYKTSGTDDI